MTTKIKIILGFSAMIVLMAALTFIGYTSLETAAGGFTEYRRLARLNSMTGDMVAGFNKTAADIYHFTAEDDKESLESARANLSAIAKLVETATPLSRKAENTQTLKHVLQAEQNLLTAIDAMATNLAEVRAQYANTIAPASRRMVGHFIALHETAIENTNTPALRFVMQGMSDFTGARSAISRFGESIKESDGADALARLNTVGETLNKLSSVLVTSRCQALHAAIDKEYNTLHGALAVMLERCKAFQGNLAEAESISATIETDLRALSKEMHSQTDILGPKTDAANASAQKMTLGMSAGGLALGVVLALLTTAIILRILRELGNFADATATGNFNYQVKIKEKGDVGVMVEAMQRVAATLKTVLAEYQDLEKRVENGELGANSDPARFSGDFATLIKGTNAVLERFRLVLETITAPVVMLDKDLKASYLNAKARELAGEDYHGKTCFQLFGREDFDSDTDALKKALESRRACFGETRAHPQGVAMDISYTATPMYDKAGNLVSVLQLITDLTAVKETQRAIMNVASQAANISNRVAAASEELSAQVEQVSRGAEMQRSRMESTASAMMEMNTTVLEVARNAGQASEQTELTRSKADNGAGLVNQVVHSINEVNQVATAMHTNMQELGGQAESIGGVMNVISDIADQTNLLALNAAIEAARAGEAGRGFAVVADEVRKLAEKTMEATSQVGSSITAIQHSARVNIEAMANASKAVGEATSLANSSGTALTEIVDLASGNSALVASIATAAEEQSATSDEINGAINEVTQIVNETTEGMVQASSAVQELSRMAQELNRIMGELQQ